MNADGTGVEQLTTTGSSWFPQFSPDGTRIALHVQRDVHVLDLATKTLRRLTTDPLNGMYPTWSPDGRARVHDLAQRPDGDLHDGRRRQPTSSC